MPRVILLLFAVIIAAHARGECPPLSQTNTAIHFLGIHSSCSPAKGQLCYVGEPLVFNVLSFGYTFADCGAEVEWRFGDALMAGGSSVMHTYTAAGIYAVTATIRTATQTIELQRELMAGGIVIEAGPFHVAPLVDDGRPIARGYRFNVVLAAGEGDWVWDFGDGTTASGPERERTHVYAQGGTYRVRLSSTRGTQSYTLTVTVPPPRRRVVRH